jgi:hypothetical protein
MLAYALSIGLDEGCLRGLRHLVVTFPTFLLTRYGLEDDTGIVGIRLPQSHIF